jgi:hypothetical protein
MLSQQLLAFLDSLPVAGLEGKTQFRRRCLSELRQARGEGLLTGSPELAALQRQLASLAKAHPQAILRAQWPPLEAIAEDLASAGHTNLSWLLRQHSLSAGPLLVLLVRFFIRGEVETNPQLARGLTFRQVELLSQRQRTSLEGLNDALRAYRPELEQLLQAWLEPVDSAGASGAAVRRAAPSGSGSGPIRVHCPHCHKLLSTPHSKKAVQFGCPLCGRLFVLPARGNT